MFKIVKTQLLMLLSMTLIVGIIYPLSVHFLTHLFSPDKKEIELLIGQQFTAERFFWGRPSAGNYQTLPSSASHWSVTNPQLKESVLNRPYGVNIIKEIPSELLFNSGSGLDPHISVQGALWQTERVAKARHIDEKRLKELILSLTEKPQWGFLGRERINVLKLNLALEELKVH